jgi:hypothetical protein
MTIQTPDALACHDGVLICGRRHRIPNHGGYRTKRMSEHVWKNRQSKGTCSRDSEYAEG